MMMNSLRLIPSICSLDPKGSLLFKTPKCPPLNRSGVWWCLQVIYRCSLMAILGVTGSLMGSVLCFLKGCVYVINSFIEYTAGSRKVILMVVAAIGKPRTAGWCCELKLFVLCGRQTNICLSYRSSNALVWIFTRYSLAILTLPRPLLMDPISLDYSNFCFYPPIIQWPILAIKASLLKTVNMPNIRNKVYFCGAGYVYESPPFHDM